MVTRKRISQIEEKEVVSLFSGDLLLTKLESSIIMVSKDTIGLINIDLKTRDEFVSSSTKEAIHKMVSNLKREGMTFAQLLLIELVQRDLVPEELSQV